MNNENSTEKFSLWHYTDVEALEKIISNKTLRSTRINDLNDEVEVLHGIEFLESLSLGSTEASRNEIKHMLEEFKQNGIQNDSYFITSFSQEEDSLYQWHAYGKNDGVAIKFEFEATIGFSDNIKYKQVRDFEYNNKLYSGKFWPAIKTCEYIKKERDKSTYKYSPQLIKKLKQNTDDELLGIVQESSKKCYLIAEPLRLKHDAFKFEKEVRFITDATDISETTIDLSFEPSKIITHVMISPFGDKEERLARVNKILKNNNLSKIEPNISLIPYRDKGEDMVNFNFEPVNDNFQTILINWSKENSVKYSYNQSSPDSSFSPRHTPLPETSFVKITLSKGNMWTFFNFLKDKNISLQVEKMGETILSFNDDLTEQILKKFYIKNVNYDVELKHTPTCQTQVV